MVCTEVRGKVESGEESQMKKVAMGRDCALNGTDKQTDRPRTDEGRYRFLQ